MKIKIDKHVPPPTKTGSGRPEPKTDYPFKQLQIGESFVIKKDEIKEEWRLLYYKLTSWGQRNARRFATRTLDANTVRIWRIK